MEFFTSIQSLDLSNNEILDLTSLSDLEYLKDLNLYKNKITDIKPLEKLKKLRKT